MKTFLLIIGITISLAVTSCRTTEANYRSAYDKASARQAERSAEGESDDIIPYGQLRKPNTPKPEVICQNGTNDSVPVLRTGVVAVDAGTELNRYNIIADGFAQHFNARALVSRLKDAGYDSAKVIRDASLRYYAVAASSDDPCDACQLWQALMSDSAVTLRAEPFILISTR